MGKLLPIPALSKPGFFFAKARAFESMPPEGMKWVILGVPAQPKRRQVPDMLPS
jgi:hypothetical protein